MGEPGVATPSASRSWRRIRRCSAQDPDTSELVEGAGEPLDRVLVGGLAKERAVAFDRSVTLARSTPSIRQTGPIRLIDDDAGVEGHSLEVRAAHR